MQTSQRHLSHECATKSPAEIRETQSLLSTGAVLRLSFLSHKHLCGSNGNNELERVLRELQHLYFTCFHLTCISKWRKTQLQMSCTTFYHVDLKQLVKLEWRSEKWGGQTQSENSLPADWLSWPDFFLYVKKKKKKSVFTPVCLERPVIIAFQGQKCKSIQ